MLRQVLASEQSARAHQAGMRSVNALVKATDLSRQDNAKASTLYLAVLRAERAGSQSRLDRSVVDLLNRASKDDSHPDTRDLAALLLSDIDPLSVLSLEPPFPRSAMMIEARARSRLRREQPVKAAREFDELAQVAGPLGQLPVRNHLRLLWVQTLQESGRLHAARVEGEHAVEELKKEISVAKGELKLRDLLSRAPQGNNTTDATDAERATEREALLADLAEVQRLLAYYSVDLGRVANQQGRYTDAWLIFQEASKLDVGDDALVRGVVAHINMVMAPTAEQGVRCLESVWSVADPSRVGSDTQWDTRAIQASFFLAARWEDHEGGWDRACVSAEVPAEGVRESLAVARSRGLVMAREILSRAGGQEVRRDVENRIRVALLAGDELMAQELIDSWRGDARNSWAGRVLRAVCHLQSGQEQDQPALRLMREVMAERRFDLDLRALYAHTALLAGEVTEAAQECLEILEMAPEHVVARVVRAECSFEMALRSSAKSASGDPSGTEAAAAMENVHQLIGAVRDYRAALVLDARTKRFFEDGHVCDGEPLGSDVLTPRQVVQACRRGLHAGIIAQEGVDRLGLKRDTAMEKDARSLAVVMRHYTRDGCRRCERERGGRLGRLRSLWRPGHELVRHGLDRDEVARLTSLLTGYRRAKWVRRGLTAAVMAVGARPRARCPSGLGTCL